MGRGVGFLDQSRVNGAEAKSRRRLRMLESASVVRSNRRSQTPKVGMISLGCAKNLVDAEVMLGHLVERGATIVRDEHEADVVIVNTCGFIDSAKQESVEAILEVAARKRAGTLKRLVVAGCMVQRYADELRAEIPEVDAFIGLDELERVGDAVLGDLGRGPHPRPARGAAPVRPHGAAHARDRRRLRLSQGRGGVRQPVHVLPHPGDARAFSLALGGVAGGRGAAPRGAPASPSWCSSPRTPRATARIWASAATGCAACSRRCSPARRCRGSASSTPTRRRSTRGSSR